MSINQEQLDGNVVVTLLYKKADRVRDPQSNEFIETLEILDFLKVKFSDGTEVFMQNPLRTLEFFDPCQAAAHTFRLEQYNYAERVEETPGIDAGHAQGQVLVHYDDTMK